MMDRSHMSSGDWFWMIVLWLFLFWSTFGILGMWAVKQWQTIKREASPVTRPRDLAA